MISRQVFGFCLFAFFVFKDIDIFSFGKSSNDFLELISNLILGDKFN